MSDPSMRPTLAQLAIAGAATVAAATIANVAAAFVLTALLDVDPAFEPLGPPAVAAFTIVLVGIGMVVYGIVARRAPRPSLTWLIVAIGALVVSFVPDLGLLLDPDAAPIEAVTTEAVLALMVLHVVAGVIAILLPLRLAPVPDRVAIS